MVEIKKTTSSVEKNILNEENSSAAQETFLGCEIKVLT